MKVRETTFFEYILQKTSDRAVRAALVTFVSIVWSSTAFGQGSGSIVGSVVDPSGNGVPEATVTATNEGTQISRSTQADSKGDYLIPLLNSGKYSVRAEKSGFQVGLSAGVIVQVSQSSRVDFQLQVGVLTQTLEVTAAVPLLQTSNATEGQVIGNEPVQTLPLNGRDFLSLAVLSPASVTQQGNTLRINQTGSYAGQNQPVIAGSRQDSSTMLLDGFLNSRPYDGTPVLRPSIDAIQEFKIEFSNFTADNGRNPALVQIATKSGTNQIHGAVWEFLRNSALDAREFFDKTVPPLQRNQFGAVVSGPIVIPHLYDGKNKTFFMFNWESSRYRIGQTQSANFIPPQFYKNGDFSSLKTQLYDPATTNPATGQRQPFVGNQIPLNRLDPVALNMANMFQATPNSAGSPNTIGQIKNPEDNNQYTGRVDHVFGNNSIMARFSYGHDTGHTPSLQPYGGQYALNTDITTGITWTNTIRPSLLNTARIGWLTARTYLEQEAVFENKNLNALSGIQNINFFPPFSYSVPLVGCSGSSYRCPTGGQSFKEISNVWEYGDLLSWTHGSHTTNFGTTIYQSRNVWASGGATGNWSFNGQYTAQQGAGFVRVPGTGDSVADFLLGQSLTAGVTSAGGNGDYNDTYYSVFAQDQWRVTPKLTLNLGVNWQYSGPYIERYGRMSFPDFSPQAKALGGRQLNTCNPANAYNKVFNPGNNYGTIVDPSLCIDDPGQGAREFYDFQPRLGLAYRLRSNTVVRAGFGLFFNNPQWASEMAGMSGDPPFPLFLSLISTSFITTQYPLHTLLPPQNQLTGQATGRLVGPEQAARRIPLTYQYNLSVQHEFTANNLIEVGYIGTASHHLQMGNVPINQAVPDPPGVTTPIVSRLPYPNFGGVGGLSLTVRGASANYNAGFAKFERRFSKGFSLLTSFTYSHNVGWPVGTIAYVSGGPSSPIQSGYCVVCDRGDTDEDVPLRFAVSGIYSLPFGSGQSYLSDAKGVWGQLVSGWQLNGIAQFQSGLPFSCLDPVDNANVGYGGRCNLAPGHTSAPSGEDFRTTGYAFDPTYFAPKVLGQVYGNSGRNILRTGKMNNIDMSVFKNFTLKEGVTLQFRAEFFNAFNITQFITPVNAINNPSFGKYVPSTAIASPATAPARQIQFALKLQF